MKLFMPTRSGGMELHMHIWTFKFNKKTAVLLLIALAAALALLTIGIGASDRAESSGVRAETNEERVSYLNSMGWQVSPECVEEKTVVIPKEFSDIYDSYNQLQLSQGFDLGNYRGRTVTIFTYAVEDYKGYEGAVVADMYVCEGRVIGGDIHSLALDGFMHGIVSGGR